MLELIMGRSVSCPRGAVWKVFVRFDGDCEDWDDFVYNIKGGLRAAFPSLREDDKWLDREDRVLLSNGHADVGISEYCGLVCVWGVPREFDYREPENREALAHRWLVQTDAKFEKAVAGVAGPLLRSLGYASNGEQFFRVAG